MTNAWLILLMHRLLIYFTQMSFRLQCQFYQHKMYPYPQSIPLGALSHICHPSTFILCGAVKDFTF